MKYVRKIFDNFTLALLGVVLIATFLPCSGDGAVFFGWLTNLAIGLLFFLHGAKLSREAIIAGASHWRLHLLVFACTFVMFPLLGMAFKPLFVPLVGNELYLGVLYLCALPATVQSAIAFTSLARGNIPAAICSAAASSLLGIFLTPLLVMLLLGAEGDTGSGLDAVLKITLQLLVPFVAGQVARRWIGEWVKRNARWLKIVDQGSILLVVYTAFSDAVVTGLWHTVSAQHLAGLFVVCGILLAAVLFVTRLLGRVLGFSVEDRITILFAGSKKSLATGVPMAQVLFVGGGIGAMILPLMLFHQIQLMVCAVLAQKYAARGVEGFGGFLMVLWFCGLWAYPFDLATVSHLSALTAGHFWSWPKVTKAARPASGPALRTGSLAAVSCGASRPPAGYASLHLATSATPKGATRLPLQTPPLGLLMGRKLRAAPGLALFYSMVLW